MLIAGEQIENLHFKIKFICRTTLSLQTVRNTSEPWSSSHRNIKTNISATYQDSMAPDLVSPDTDTTYSVASNGGIGLAGTGLV